ncbi:MAG: zf-HC2 domain-containing protein [Blastocatellia bacterium]
MRLNNKEDLTPICATENVPLFVMYVKGELPEQHKSKLEAHLSHCADCKMNLAYVKEILQFKHPLSADEKTLLLKYLSDPLFYYFIHDIRKKVLSDVRDILKEVNIHLKSNENTEIDKDGKINQSSKLSYQKRPYSYAVMTLAIAGFLSLGSLIVLGLSVKYPALQSYLPFSKQNSLAINETSSNSLSSDFQINLSKTTDNNRYQQLDTAIDEFLATQNREHLVKAESIAKDIQLFYEDNYGVDLVGYYQSVPDLAISKLVNYRKEFTTLESMPKGDNYQQRMEKSQALANDFLLIGNLPESYKVKNFVFKCMVKNYQHTKANLLFNEAISFTKQHNYKLLTGQFLLWKGKHLSLSSDFVKTEETFKEALNIGEKLQSKQLIASCGSSLAALYQTNNEDKKALEIAQKLLSQSQQNPELFISLNQIAGIAAFKLGFHTLSNTYLHQAISDAQKINNPYLVATSWAFLGVTLTEKQDFSLAKEAYLESHQALNQIKENHSRLDALSIVAGYEAKANFLLENYSEAINLYKESLTAIEELGIDSYLEVAQLNEALAIATQKTGNVAEAQKYIAIANNHKKLALDKNEKTNCLLSFLPKKCN